MRVRSDSWSRGRAQEAKSCRHVVAVQHHVGEADRAVPPRVRGGRRRAPRAGCGPAGPARHRGAAAGSSTGARAPATAGTAPPRSGRGRLRGARSVTSDAGLGRVQRQQVVVASRAAQVHRVALARADLGARCWCRTLQPPPRRARTCDAAQGREKPWSLRLDVERLDQLAPAFALVPQEGLDSGIDIAGSASEPSASSLCATSGCRSTASRSRLTRAITSGDVPAGANRPFQPVYSKPGKLSAKVGTLGSSDCRCAVLIASARTWPDLR